MVYEIRRTDEEIDEQLEKAFEQKEELGTKWPSMSYEEGVLAALDWVFGNIDDAPIESDD